MQCHLQTGVKKGVFMQLLLAIILQLHNGYQSEKEPLESCDSKSNTMAVYSIPSSSCKRKHNQFSIISLLARKIICTEAHCCPDAEI